MKLTDLEKAELALQAAVKAMKKVVRNDDLDSRRIVFAKGGLVDLKNVLTAYREMVMRP